MNYINSNIGYLRKRKGLTLSEFADTLKVGKTTVSNWENERNYPSIDLIIQMSQLFNISLDLFMTKDLINEISKEELNEIQKQKLKSLLEKRQNYTRNLFVPIKAQAGYAEGWDNNEILKELESINIPFKSNDKELRTFEVAGSSMIPLVFAGDLLVCTKVERNDIFHVDNIYIVVTKSNGIYVKHLELIEDRRKIKLISSNDAEYKPSFIDLDDILEIWQTKLKVTKHLTSVSLEKNDSTLARRMSRLEQILIDKLGDSL